MKRLLRKNYHINLKVFLDDVVMMVQNFPHTQGMSMGQNKKKTPLNGPKYEYLKLAFGPALPHDAAIVCIENGSKEMKTKAFWQDPKKYLQL